MSKEKTFFGQSDIVRLSDEDAATELLERAVTGLWEVVNELTRFRRTTRQNYRVTIFGSARLKPGTPAYEGVKQLAAELTKMGCDIISGGGPGLMQAANEGAQSIEKATHRSVGIRVELPFEQEVNPFVGQAYEHRTFFSRLHHFMIISDAFVVVPGGIGTLLEMSLVWQLLQVRKLYNTPLILVGKMWSISWNGRARRCCRKETSSRAKSTSGSRIAQTRSRKPSHLFGQIATRGWLVRNSKRSRTDLLS